MGAVVVDISMSLDGFVAGPDDGLGRGLGSGGERIHNWVMGGSWTYEGGPPMRASGVDREVLDEMFDHTAKKAPLKRNIDGDEVGKTAVYLLSDLSSGVTGETLYVDSGFNTVGL